MITLQASSIDELNLIWKKIRSDFQVIEGIHLDSKSLQYRMVINQPELTKMLRGVADKVIDHMDLFEDNAFEGILSLKKLSERIEMRSSDYQSLEPLGLIWEVISQTDKKAIFSYLVQELGSEMEEVEQETADQS
jgi:hypothetical protein